MSLLQGLRRGEARGHLNAIMATFLFLAGPPASGQLWGDAIRRVEQRGHLAEAIDLFDTDPESPRTWSTSVQERVATGTDPIVLIAHGAAVPVALHVAAHSPPTGLVLSNGPLEDLPLPYRVASSMARAPGPLGQALLRPELQLRWLASSLGLRRTVVNPYVWDHDTVVTICGPIFGDHDIRGRVRRFMAALPQTVASAPPPTVPTLLLWGDQDPLLPRSNADLFSSKHDGTSVVTVQGGHHFHPLERPWEIADRTIDWYQSHLTTT